MIYFDNAATTYPKPEEVYKAADEALRNYGVNAGRGSYKLSKMAYKIIRDTKEKLISMVNADGDNIVVFSPSATIALNQIINGLEWDEHSIVYISPFEHNAISRTLHCLQGKYGFKIEIIPFEITKVKNKVRISFNEKEFVRMLSINKPQYMFISHVSNVIGYELPVKKIIQLVKEINDDCVVTLDCAQSMGLIDIDMKKLNADYLVFAGHKTLYGILGIGGFIKNNSKELREFLTGGTGSDSLNLNMPIEGSKRYEVGSKNIQAIAALNASLNWIENKDIKVIRRHEKKLTKTLIEGLSRIHGVTLYIADKEENQNGIVAFNLARYTSEQLAEILDSDFEICVRAGYHCSPYIHEFIGTKSNGDDIAGVVRVSLSNFNTLNEVEIFVDTIRELYEEI